jgi:hypothetical protein
MKYLSKTAFGPALAIAAILSLSACTTPVNREGCCHMQCCKMQCCSGKESCCKDSKGPCCAKEGKMKGCPYTPKANN